jgi:methylase of polypeptide subunit release factors
MSSGTEPQGRFATEPFIEGTAEQYTRLREWLVAMEYTEAALCAKANVRTIAHLNSLGERRTVFTEPTDKQSLLVLLFLVGDAIAWTTLRSLLSPDEVSAITDLGLLVPSVAEAECCVAPVAVIPVEGLYVVSDRLAGLEVVEGSTPADIVYSPITPETARFVGLMPRFPCESYLEMCGGSGIAALIAARDFARHAWSADITERSTRFARFSGALNGLTNFTAVQGDLYEPVGDRTFDLITAHPPYVPAEETEMVFRDGGADGEQITRRIVAEVEPYLRPGGQLYLDCVMTDRAGDPLEQRVRRMLGPSEGEFDVVVIRGGVVDPRIYRAERLQSGQMTLEAFLHQTELFKRLRVEQFVATTVMIQRRASERPVVTRHRVLTSETRAHHLQWVLDYLSRTVEWGSDDADQILSYKLRASPRAELRVRSVLRDGEWSPVEARIAAMTPFAVEAPCPPILSTLLARCDGRLSGREHLVALRASGDVPPEKTDADFAQLIRELADAAYLELDAFPHR